MVEVLFWLVLLAYILYISQIIVSLIYWSLCLIPWCITFKKSPSKFIKSIIKLDLLSNVARLLGVFVYPMYVLWGTISFSYESGILNMMFSLFVLNAIQLTLRDSRDLSKDYEEVMTDFTKYFKYGLFSYNRLLRGYLNG